jgi:magnesium-transporting ATPase (P-type)
MLWVNLIMDSLGSLALATEPPYDELLKREPTKRNESIINGKMWKHIGAQSLFQLILLIIFFLLAPEFIKEQNLVRVAENNIILACYGELPGGKSDPSYIIYGPQSKWGNKKLVLGSTEEVCGKYAERQDLSFAYKEYMDSNGASCHMTLIFAIFVFYTLFNQINCRVIDDSFNIFVRILRSYLFIIIMLCEMGLEVLIVMLGNTVFHCVENGLTGKQWGICFGFSAITFVVSIIFKLIPLEKCIEPYLTSEPIEEEETEKKISNKISESETETKIKKYEDNYIKIGDENNNKGLIEQEHNINNNEGDILNINNSNENKKN